MLGYHFNLLGLCLLLWISVPSGFGAAMPGHGHSETTTMMPMDDPHMNHDHMNHDHMNHDHMNHSMTDNDTPDHGMAHDMNGTMDHGAMDHMGMNHTGMDHNGMNHTGMDHNSMNHTGMNHNGMNHTGMDHNSMNHTGMDHDGMDHGGMDHNGMDHEGMDHNGMDHNGMDHTGMDHSTSGHTGGHASYFFASVESTILFFEWTTTTWMGMLGSCIAVLVASALYEGFKVFREDLFCKHQSSTKGPKKHGKSCKIMCTGSHVIQSLLHLVQVTVSYMLMLVFMTFNVYLCVALVLGAGLGYFLFAWRRSIMTDVNEHCV